MSDKIKLRVDLTSKEDTSNKSSSISTDTGSTTKYPTVKAVEDYVSLQVSEDYGTFTELQTLINNTSNGSTLNLDKDYQCQNGENLIEINNYININGNGHIIDGNNMSNIGMYGATNLYNVKFINCHSDYNGGAVYIYGTIKIDNCLFMNNTSDGNGGALDFESDDSVVTNCVFINNKSQSNGGVLYSEYEGYKFINCIFSNNSSDSNGGALWVAPYEDDVTIKDCIFVDNTANGDGGGIYAYTHEEIKVYNCTFENSTLYNATNVDYLTEHQSLKTINSQSLIGNGNIDVSPTIDSDWVNNSTNPIQSKVIKTALDNKLDKTYTSYKGKNVVTNASTGAIEFEEKNNHTHNQYLTSHQDISGKEDTSNKSSSISTDTGSTSKYPTVKAVEDYAQPKGNYLTQHQSLTNYLQKTDVKDNLTSTDTDKPLSAKQGKELKTLIDNKPTVTVDSTWVANSTNPIQSKEIKTALDGKANVIDFYYDNLTDELVINTSTETDFENLILKEDKSNKVSSWSNTPDNNHYPTEKLVKDYVDEMIGDILEYINS